MPSVSDQRLNPVLPSSQVFVQLDELCGEGEDREWKETARWIKYEEHVEEGADRWGRPHVASLSFHSLLNLRRCLETGKRPSVFQTHDHENVFPVLLVKSLVNPLPPSDAVRKQKKVFYRIFLVQYCHALKNITPLET